MLVLGRQPVVDRHHLDAGPRAELGADVVMAVQPAEDEAAAVEIDDARLEVRGGGPVDADRHVAPFGARWPPSFAVTPSG